MHPSRPTFPSAALVAALLMLSACTAGQDYHLPPLSLPALWNGLKGAPTGKATPADALNKDENTAWWKHFNDENLNTLIAEAEQNNRDLKIAAARVREARAERVIAESALLPEIQGKASGTHGNAQNFFNGKPFALYDTNFDAAWEIDLFGSNRRKAEAASAGAEEAEANVRGALISLRAEVARNYFDLRNVQQQLKITRETAQSEEETWKLTREMNKAGTVSGLDAAQAEAQYATTRARVPELEAQETAAKNQLSVLLGRQPQAAENSTLDEAKPLPVADSAVVVATPADVIARRPDVAASERELAAKTALHGAAIADLYPKISLSALFGDMHSTFGGFTSREWSGGAGLAAPIFNAGRLRANVRASDAEAQAALDSYEQTVLKALAEVDTSLTNYLKEDEKRAALKNAADAAALSAKLARERYQKGLDPFINVLTAERTSFEAQSALAASEATVAKNLVALYKSLGV